MRARVAGEDGFSLVELLAALVVGSIVLFATLGLLDNAVRLQAKAVDSLDATDRGRTAIDRISRSLASRICLGSQTSLVDARDDRVEFYASLAPESSAVRLVVQRRRLTVTGTTMREAVWTSTPPLPPPNLPPASTTTPSSDGVVVSGIARDGSTPVFRYYAYEGTPATPTQLLATPLSAIDLSRVARIDVAFKAQGKRADVATAYSNRIVNRIPTCVS